MQCKGEIKIIESPGMEINAINMASVLYSFQQEATDLLQKNRSGGPVYSPEVNTALLGFP